MSAVLNRNFKVKGDISCLYTPGTVPSTINIANIEIQLWHKSPMQVALLGKGNTNSDGEFTIEFEVDSPVSYIVDGKITDVFLEAFYNGEKLTINEPRPLVEGLVAYWKLDGDSNDSVNTHNGTDTSITYSDANGIINNGAGLNGTTSKILVPDSADWSMGDGEFTISMWVKRNATGLNAICGQIDSAGHDATLSFALQFDSSDYLIAYFGTGTLTSVSSVNPIADTDWHYIVFTRRTNVIYLYLDAVLQNSADVTGQTMLDSAYDLGIGAQGDYAGYLFKGSIDEVGIWKGRGLTADEIETLYDSGHGLQYPF